MRRDMYLFPETRTPIEWQAIDRKLPERKIRFLPQHRGARIAVTPSVKIRASKGQLDLRLRFNSPAKSLQSMLCGDINPQIADLIYRRSAGGASRR